MRKFERRIADCKRGSVVASLNGGMVFLQCVLKEHMSSAF